MKCPIDECNYVCFDKESSMTHCHDAHSECGQTVSQDVVVVSDDYNTEDGETMMTEETDIQVGEIEPLFVTTMAICPIKYRREFELDLWANRPDTADEAIDRAIMLCERYTPPTPSLF